MKNFRWVLISLAFVGILITYLDRMALSYAIGPLEKTFSLNNTEFGMIASGFGIGYLCVTIASGILIDHYGARKIWSLSALLWTVACVLIGMATGFWWLLLCRILLGVAEGPSFPALARITADWLLPRERARAFAFALLAVPLSFVIGASLLSFIIVHFNWRFMFIMVGIFSLIWVMAWQQLFRDKPSDSKHIGHAELLRLNNMPKTNPVNAIKKSTPWRYLVFNPALLTNHIAFFALGYLLFFALTWLPAYFEQSYHIKLASIGQFLTIPWLVAALMLLLGGFLSDYLWKKTHNFRLARSHIVWICQVLSAGCLLYVIKSHSPYQAIVGISLGLGFGMMPNAIFFAINTDLARDRAATSLGIMDCAFAASGILAPFLTGKLSTLTGNFNSAIYLMIGITTISALGVILFQYPNKEA